MHLYVVPTVVLREARKSGHIVGEGKRRERSFPNHDRLLDFTRIVHGAVSPPD
jgi:hypothetical protein